MGLGGDRTGGGGARRRGRAGPASSCAGPRGRSVWRTTTRVADRRSRLLHQLPAGGGHRPVAHDAEPRDRAVGPRIGVGGDRGDHRPRPQQPGGVLLVVAVEIERHVADQRRQGGQHPGRPARSCARSSSWLNPHVHPDTVVLLGSIAQSTPGASGGSRPAPPAAASCGSPPSATGRRCCGRCSPPHGRGACSTPSSRWSRSPSPRPWWAPRSRSRRRPRGLRSRRAPRSSCPRPARRRDLAGDHRRRRPRVRLHHDRRLVRLRAAARRARHAGRHPRTGPPVGRGGRRDRTGGGRLGLGLPGRPTGRGPVLGRRALKTLRTKGVVDDGREHPEHEAAADRGPGSSRTWFASRTHVDRVAAGPRAAPAVGRRHGRDDARGDHPAAQPGRVSMRASGTSVSTPVSRSNPMRYSRQNPTGGAGRRAASRTRHARRRVRYGAVGGGGSADSGESCTTSTWARMYGAGTSSPATTAARTRTGTGCPSRCR